jgi:hypothetical protein
VRPWGVLLRMLHHHSDGRPSPLARLVALVLLIGLVGLSAPVLVPVVFWVLGLL